MVHGHTFACFWGFAKHDILVADAVALAEVGGGSPLLFELNLYGEYDLASRVLSKTAYIILNTSVWLMSRNGCETHLKEKLCRSNDTFVGSLFLQSCFCYSEMIPLLAVMCSGMLIGVEPYDDNNDERRTPS